MFIQEKLSLEALDISHQLDEKVDTLLLVNAMYAANIDKKVKIFLEENKDKIGCIVNINSSASGKSTYDIVKKVASPLGIVMSDKEFHTVASWIFLNKGRPNVDDFKRLEDFLQQFKEN